MENKCKHEIGIAGGKAYCKKCGIEINISPKEECNDKDDMFARTNEGDGYMQCQIHLRNSIKCDRLHKHLVSSPKEEYCGFCDSSNGHLKECPDSPKEEIVNDWESELSEIIFQIQRCPKQYRTCFNCKETLESHISSLLSSTEKRVKEEERQFILNILDGIDKADEEMGNTGGGTKAIRLALKSRI